MIAHIRGEGLNVSEVTVNGGGVRAKTDAGINRVPSYRRGSRFRKTESNDQGNTGETYLLEQSEEYRHERRKGRGAANGEAMGENS